MGGRDEAAAGTSCGARTQYTEAEQTALRGGFLLPDPAFLVLLSGWLNFGGLPSDFCGKPKGQEIAGEGVHLMPQGYT